MKVGISTGCFHARSETEDAFEQIKQAGAECVEVGLQTFYEYRPEFAKKYAPRANGLTVNSVHPLSYNFEPQLFFDSRRQRGDGFYWLDQVMRSAQLFGAHNYTFHGFVRKVVDRDDFDKIAERLNEAIYFCKRYGVRLCLENVNWSLYNRPGVFRELKNRCSELFGVFDIKQARKSGYPYGMYINDMAGSISHVHISDMDENGKTCLPSFGVYDFTEVLTRLKDAGFDGALIIETDNAFALDELARSVEFLKEIVYKIK